MQWRQKSSWFRSVAIQFFTGNTFAHGHSLNQESSQLLTISCRMQYVILWWSFCCNCSFGNPTFQFFGLTHGLSLRAAKKSCSAAGNSDRRVFLIYPNYQRWYNNCTTNFVLIHSFLWCNYCTTSFCTIPMYVNSIVTDKFVRNLDSGLFRTDIFFDIHLYW